jgi:hypothetical protein
MLLGKAAAAASFVLLQQKRNQQQQSTATTVVVCGGGDFVVNTDGIASTCSFCFMVGTDASSRFCLVVLVELTVKNARFPFFFTDQQTPSIHHAVLPYTFIQQLDISRKRVAVLNFVPNILVALIPPRQVFERFYG